MKERLWISSMGSIVCERISCMGEDLFGTVVQERGLSHTVRVNGESWSAMSKADMAEFGALLAGMGNPTVVCSGGHVEYVVAAHELRLVIPVFP